MMVMDWWKTREPRERILILIAAVLIVLIGAWYGVISPLANAKADARQGLATAIEDKALIDTALARLDTQSISTIGPAENFDAFRLDVTNAAQRRGLSIFRLQGNDDGGLQLIFNDVAPNDVFLWLEDISARPGGAVLRANITMRGDKVQAVIELQGTQG